MSRYSASVALVLILNLSGNSLLASQGGSTGGGGNLWRIYPNELAATKASGSYWRKKQLESFILSSAPSGLKDRVTRLVLDIEAKNVVRLLDKVPTDFKRIQIFLKSRRSELIADINSSFYITHLPPEINSKMQELDAYTFHSLTADVYFNLNHLARYRIPLERQKNMMAALVFHEHVRHLGFRDDHHDLGRLAATSKYDVIDREHVRAFIYDFLEGIPYPRKINDDSRLGSFIASAEDRGGYSLFPRFVRDFQVRFGVLLYPDINGQDLRSRFAKVGDLVEVVLEHAQFLDGEQR